MAERAIASAVEKLGQVLVQETTFLQGVRADVEWLQSQLRWMECFLKDADVKGRKDERMKNWVREVRDVAYQAEDVVDIFMWQIERRRGAIKEYFRRYACIPSELIGLHGIGNEILQIKFKINNIQVSRAAYGIVNLGESRAESSGGSVDETLQVLRQSSPRLDADAVVVSFDVHTKSILAHLLDANLTRRCVISVVGMGGLGKTTLATRVYNSHRVKSHFITCAWITVSQEYRVRELVKNVIKQLMGTLLTKEDLESLDKMDLDELKHNLSYFLQHRRYLIVLDDIWEQALWEQLKNAFPNEMNGSRVLITTRFMDVAKSADPRIPPYELPFLSDEESLELFLKVVFPTDQGVTPRCPEQLKELGHVLVKRCGGLPLAVVVLGGLLSITNPTVSSWREVAENKEWESRSQGKECLQILALSYNHLPHHNLKSCFLYLGCFPEDYKINVTELIRLWIAEGFIPQSAHRTLEETARSYLDELVQRCMVQVVDRTITTRRVKNFQIHDLFRDWCISEAKIDGFFRICGNYNDTEDHVIIDTRRLVLYGELSAEMFCYSTYRARTILGFNLEPADKLLLKNIVYGFKLLKVIYLHFQEEVRFHRRGLPKEISRLIHLRHIAIIANGFRYVPSSIGKLHSLQTLYLRKSYDLFLPKTLYTIQTLRHIDTSNNINLHRQVIERLRSLQTLKNVYAGSWIQRDLAKLVSLRKLAIHRVTATNVAALFDSLQKLNHLTSLHLVACYGSQPRAATLFAPFPNHRHLYKLTLGGQWTAIHGLPQNLINLQLVRCELDREAIDALERLPSLAILDLYRCRYIEEDGEMVCSAGGFTQLQSLHFELFNLQHWRIESGGMPNLNYLKLEACRGLLLVPDGLQHVASLQKLVIEYYHTDLLGRISDGGEDHHKIQNIPSVEVNGRSLDQWLEANTSMVTHEMANTIVGSPPAETQGLADPCASTSYGHGST